MNVSPHFSQLYLASVFWCKSMCPFNPLFHLKVLPQILQEYESLAEITKIKQNEIKNTIFVIRKKERIKRKKERKWKE